MWGYLHRVTFHIWVIAMKFGGFDGLDKGHSAHSKVLDAQNIDARAL